MNSITCEFKVALSHANLFRSALRTRCTSVLALLQFYNLATLITTKVVAEQHCSTTTTSNVVFIAMSGGHNAHREDLKTNPQAARERRCNLRGTTNAEEPAMGTLGPALVSDLRSI